MKALQKLADEENLGHLFKRELVEYHDLNDVDDDSGMMFSFKNLHLKSVLLLFMYSIFN